MKSKTLLAIGKLFQKHRLSIIPCDFSISITTQETALWTPLHLAIPEKLNGRVKTQAYTSRKIRMGTGQHSEFFSVLFYPLMALAQQ